MMIIKNEPQRHRGTEKGLYEVSHFNTTPSVPLCLCDALSLSKCGCRFLLAAVLVLTFTTLSLQAGVTYRTDLSVRAGYHLFTGAGSWNEGYSQTMDEDLFFRDETFNPDNDHVYYSDNVDTSVDDRGPGMPVVTLEYSSGFDPGKLPLLKRAGALSGFRGLRAGVSLSWYPVASTEGSFYSGAIVYRNTKAVAPEPEYLEYQGDITLRERLFILVPGVSLAYHHERGFGLPFGKARLVPFAGLEIGTALVSGERRISLRSDTLHVASTGEDRAVEADIQESFFNAVSPRAGIFAGAGIAVGDAGTIDIRLGAVYQENRVELTRTGSWSESIDGARYTRRVHDEKRELVFSQTGFTATVGYSLRLR